MKREFSLVGVLVLASLIAIQAQATKPSGEVKKLSAFIGTWSIDGEVKPGNGYGAPPGKYTQVERYQWLPGEVFLQMNREGKGPAGQVKHTLIFGYDIGAKKYSVALFDLNGGATVAGSGTNTGNTWTWSNAGRTGDGKPFQERCTITLVSSVSFTANCETSADAKTWSPAFVGKGTKS